MGTDFFENPPQSAARLCRRGAQAGRCAARRRRQRAGRHRRPAPARAGERRAGPRHGIVDHARRLQDQPSSGGTLHDRHGAGSTSTGCSPRITAPSRTTRPSALFDTLLAERAVRRSGPLRRAALSAQSAGAADRRPPSRLSRRLEPRGDAPRAARPGGERGRRRGQPRACRRSGRCGCSPRTPAAADLRLAGRRRSRLGRYSSRLRPAC